MVFERLNFANCYVGTTSAACGINVLRPAVIRDCTFENCYYGIDCNAVNVVPGSLITGCTANDSVTGISCSGGGIISGCTVNNNTIDGIFLNGGQDMLVSGCTANNNNYGIVVSGARNRIEDNHITIGSTGFAGIDVGGTGATNNIIIRNSVAGEGGNNYVISGTQIIGPIVTATGTITNSNPWANFSF